MFLFYFTTLHAVFPFQSSDGRTQNSNSQQPNISTTALCLQVLLDEFKAPSWACLVPFQSPARSLPPSLESLCSQCISGRTSHPPASWDLTPPLAAGTIYMTQYQILSGSSNPGGICLMTLRTPFYLGKHSVHGMLQVSAVHTIITLAAAEQSNGLSVEWPAQPLCVNKEVSDLK